MLLGIPYPVIRFILAAEAIEGQEAVFLVQSRILQYLISIWIIWLLFAGLAVYDKWTRRRDLLFYLTYQQLALGLIGIGYLIYRKQSVYEQVARANDPFVTALFASLPNLFVGAALTGLLQAAVWWFTRKRGT